MVICVDKFGINSSKMTNHVRSIIITLLTLHVLDVIQPLPISLYYTSLI